jgi:HEAT repeat protein
MLLILLFTIGLELFSLLVLFVSILYTSTRKSGRRIRRLRRLWSIWLPDALEGKRRSTSRIKKSLRSKLARENFHGFIDEQLDLATTAAQALALRHFCRTIGFTDWLLTSLYEAADELDRAGAARTLSRLREKFAHEPVSEMLNTSEDPAVVLTAGYASAAFRDPENFLSVFKAIYHRTPITLHGAAELLSGFGRGVCPVIHRHMDQLADQYLEQTPIESLDGTQVPLRTDVAVQVVMSDIVGFFKYRPVGATVLKLLDLVDDDEVLIHLVKAAGRVCDESAAHILKDFLNHNNWVLRAQAGYAMSALDSLPEEADVIPLFADGRLPGSLEEARAARRKAKSRPSEEVQA